MEDIAILQLLQIQRRLVHKSTRVDELSRKSEWYVRTQLLKSDSTKATDQVLQLKSWGNLHFHVNWRVQPRTCLHNKVDAGRIEKVVLVLSKLSVFHGIGYPWISYVR